MEIQISFQTETPRIERRKIEKALEKILEDLGCHDRELSVLFTDDEHIAALNKQYLGRMGPTNVLAFPMEDPHDETTVSPMLGDVVISLDTAARESVESGESFDETVRRLLIHGILHLLGFDHERSEGEAREMEQEELRLKNLVQNL
ncbi:MAG: rRNA maturation RNase YbeY [Deltaproteobacteria bacterium]|nr:MAG: rRNA maturation RNase YbeY [Deltaproteobacteria bacterium]